MDKLTQQIIKAEFPAARPRIALILGSGWGEVAAIFKPKHILPYKSIPSLGAATVRGHRGRLHWCELAGIETLIFEGRRHWYENVGWDPVVFPIRLAHSLGVQILVATNAAGGIRSDLSLGTLMLIEDHINAMGVNVLSARTESESATFFPDQTKVYDPDLMDLASLAAKSAVAQTAQGTYIAVSGPSYETPAEIRMYRAWGADAIGMSTVPETMFAHSLGMRVLGISCITNYAAGIKPEPLSHQDVTKQADLSTPILRQTLQALWSELAKELK